MGLSVGSIVTCTIVGTFVSGESSIVVYAIAFFVGVSVVGVATGFETVVVVGRTGAGAAGLSVASISVVIPSSDEFPDTLAADDELSIAQSVSMQTSSSAQYQTSPMSIYSL